MPAPILTTKLYLPLPRSGIVLRPRLIHHLNEGLSSGSRLTLISAPAGFGKTTLVGEWIASCGTSVAWLSLDEGDNDPGRFLSYVVAALQTIQAGIGEGLLATLASAQLPPAEVILTNLLNEITTIREHFILVLDDYHLIDTQAVDQVLAFLLNHMPSPMHLVVVTREDPHLPLARLRARDQLIELRADDLRFTLSEASEFLNQTMGLALSMEDISALETRTEGWIAGLQLAALSMQNRQDTTSFIQSFTGSHRFVLDYLVEEVLHRQTDDVRSFLLQTSLLDRLCAPLCNAVTNREDGKAMLEILERSNLFLVPLDDQCQWYRYHHLFAEVLQAFLGEAYSDQASTLHRRASIWFEQNDLPGEAILHALAARDFERAAALIEEVWLEMDLAYQSAAWLVWANALPEEIIRARPVLCVGYAWALLAIGQIEASETRLQDAERWLNLPEKPSEHSPAEMVVVDTAEFRVLPASIAAARAYRTLALGDISATKMYAMQALELVAENKTVHRTQATALLGMAEYAEGNLPAAEKQFLKFRELMWQANNIANAISITYILSNILLIQGRLWEAVSAYQQSLQLAAKRGVTVFLGASDLYRGLSELLCEQGDLEGAVQHLQTARQLGERGALTGWQHRLCIAQARIKEAQGDLADALTLLDEAERQYVRNPLPDRSIGALKARTWLRQGRVSEALAWARAQCLSTDDQLSYSHEFEHLTLARLLVAQFRINPSGGGLEAALGLLERLLHAAEEGGRKGSVIEIKVLQSLTHQAQGDLPRAMAALESALILAEPEGYMRIFVDEGEVMQCLIEKLSHNRDHPLSKYMHKLLAAFTPLVGAPYSAIHPKKIEVVEPLSERELDVLRLLRSELSGPEIAQQLFVSLYTLRTHTHHIFKKLGVNNRRAAVRRAEELGIL